MAPDKDQAEDEIESGSLPLHWWKFFREDHPKHRRILRILRSERKALLRRLGGKLTSDENVVAGIWELGLGKYAPFFQRSRGGRLRVKLLAAIGQCETLRNFDSAELDVLNLEPKEWEVLLKRMKRNCQLESFKWRGRNLMARIGRQIGELVKGAGNLKTLSICTDSGPYLGIWVNSSYLREEELAEIASGLQGQKHPKLVKLTAGPVGDLTNIAKIICSAPHLSEINLLGPCIMDENTKVVLCAVLKEYSDLEYVTLMRTSEGILEVLAKVYGQLFSDPQVSVLKNLQLLRPISLTGLACLASSNIRNLKIELDQYYMRDLCSLEEWQRVGRSLVRHPTLRLFKIIIAAFNLNSSKELGKGLAELWKASGKSPLLDISVSIRGRFLTDFIILQDALKETYLKEITLTNIAINPGVFKTFAKMVGANTSVRCLRLGITEEITTGYLTRRKSKGYPSPTALEDCCAQLFHHLRENTSIIALDLSGTKGLNDENFRDLMDLLQVNFILREVELGRTKWSKEGKGALVKAALDRNAKLAGYFSVFGAAQLSFDGAKAGPIFLCGLPFVGKTQLKVTMMECLGKTSRSESLFWNSWTNIKETVARLVPALRRTEGIEVELFYDKEAMTISIWDFAGQEVFRPLQNILFPKISQACIFICVFNPMNIVNGKIIGLKGNVHAAFAEELRRWLRFVFSNTQITGRIRPQVIVIITHKDKLENGNMRRLSFSELEKIVKKLQRDFQKVVELCPQCSGQEGKLLYHVNATIKQDLEPIKNLVISSMKDVLSRKSPKVPQVCSELVSQLLKRPTDVQNKPLWPCEELYKFCSTKSALRSLIDVTKGGRGKLLHAIASYMHDAGAVCMTPRALLEHRDNNSWGFLPRYRKIKIKMKHRDNLHSDVDSDDGSESSDTHCKKLAVVDLNWLTQNLLGQLITIGHATPVTQSHVDADGFLNTQQLEDVLHHVLSLQKDKDVDIEMVKELLLELDLCYCLERETEGKRYFFMAMLLGEGSTGTTSEQVNQPLSWGVKSPQGSGYFGYRIQCRDADRTSLSPAFFPRFQIHLRNRIGATLGVKDDNFRFARSYVEIRVDGYSIIVETDISSENHIDVLVNFCKSKTRDQAVHFIRSHIVEPLYKFCASDKGCPGVELIVAIIRIKCVEKLTPRLLRTASQVVLVEELKSKFWAKLEAYVQSEVGLKRSADSIERLKNLYHESRNIFKLSECGVSYHHCWPEIRTRDAPQFDLDAEFESAEGFLSSEEVKDIAKSVCARHRNLWRQEVPEVKRGPFQQLRSTSRVS
ncbi:hypothetical protein R1sor_016252 [Riccia sorocarpa]|uniref:Uncharacterized protein n=1 Tax=Riccia sorocarpa TaxID=122646 RepID=A0ABD3HEF4_9MARC